jgi:hypothetical protein
VPNKQISGVEAAYTEPIHKYLMAAPTTTELRLQAHCKNVYWTLDDVPNDSTSEKFFTHYCHSTPKEYVRLTIQVLDASNNVVKALEDVAVNLELWVEQQTGPPVLDDGFRLEAFTSNVGKAQRISRMQLHNGFGECFFRINQASSSLHCKDQL